MILENTASKILQVYWLGKTEYLLFTNTRMNRWTDFPSPLPDTHTQVHEAVITQQTSEFLIFQAAVNLIVFFLFPLTIQIHTALICINEHIYIHRHILYEMFISLQLQTW